VQAWSAALIFAATVVNVFTTCSIRDITQQYTAYTKAQATAEAISARAARSEATAAATEAADETISARAARDAVRIAATAQAGQVAQAGSELAQASQQLEAAKQSVSEQSRFASASEQAANTSARALADNESEQRAEVVLDSASVNYSGNIVTISMSVHNKGQSVARQVRALMWLEGFGPREKRAVQDRIESAYGLLQKTPTKNRQSFDVLAPGESKAMVAGAGMAPATWDYLKHAAGGWVFVGKVTYQDVFRHDRWAAFCTYQIGGDRATNCPDHNDEGEYGNPHLAKRRGE